VVTRLHKRVDQPLKGALLLILGEGLLAGMAAMIKHLSGELPSEIIVFCRNALGLMFLMPILLRTGGLGQLRTRRPGMHFIRAATGVGAMFCFFYTIAEIELAKAVLVKMTTPFILPLVAWLWLSETITLRTLIAIAIGFAGVVVIMDPGSGVEPVLLIALLGAFLMSVAKVSIRRMADTEPPRRIVFWFGVFSTLISAVPLLWARPLPSMDHLPWLLAIGLTATVAQIAMTTAYQVANPGKVGIYNYTAVIWAAALGWFLWAEALELPFWIGTLMITGAGIWNLRQKA
jgi:drug/metabolite transporter (DMT)-like permease